jgi:DNA-directed RNA polymerase subunit RPC12/RpoP
MDAEGTLENQKCPRCGAQPLVWRRLRPGERAGLGTRATAKYVMTGLTRPTAFFQMLGAPEPGRRVCVACERAHPEWESAFPALFVICPYCSSPNKHVVFGAKCLDCGNEYV